MQKSSLKKLSVLSVVLMGASALFAFIIPSKKEKAFANGAAIMSNSGVGNYTCKFAATGLNLCETNTASGGGDTTDLGKNGTTTETLHENTSPEETAVD